MYPFEHNSYPERTLERSLPSGVFGENLVIAGMTRIRSCD
ncbi:hypothetical protein [Sporosarcina sp. P16b]